MSMTIVTQSGAYADCAWERFFFCPAATAAGGDHESAAYLSTEWLVTMKEVAGVNGWRVTYDSETDRLELWGAYDVEEEYGSDGYRILADIAAATDGDRHLDACLWGVAESSLDRLAGK